MVYFGSIMLGSLSVVRFLFGFLFGFRWDHSSFVVVYGRSLVRIVFQTRVGAKVFL